MTVSFNETQIDWSNFTFASVPHYGSVKICTVETENGHILNIAYLHLQMPLRPFLASVLALNADTREMYGGLPFADYSFHIIILPCSIKK